MDTISHDVSSKTRKLVRINGRCSIGSTGAVSSITGAGCTVSRVGVGTYLIDLDDGFNRLMGCNVFFGSPTTGEEVDSSALVSGTTYKITTLGTASWVSLGANEATLGEVFVASATGSGDGKAYAIGHSGIFGVEIASSRVENCLQDKYGIIVHCVNASGADTDPASGSTMFFNVDARNTSVKEKGES